MTEPDQLSSVLRLQELEAENAALRRAKELRQSYGLHFYRPHVKQHKFHTSLATGRYGRTGNRFGKSEMGIAEDVAWCLGGRLWYRYPFDIRDGQGRVVEKHLGGVDHPLVRSGIPQRPVKGLIIVVDWDQVKRIFTNREGGFETWGKLFKMIPRESIGKVSVSRAGNIEQVEIKRPREFGGGSSTLSFDTIQSYKNSKISAESADWDFIHVDEPCPQAMYKAHARGLMDRNGHYWFTCTPLDEMWINDLFTPPSAPGSVISDAPDGLLLGSRYIITGSIYDNPYRSDEGVKEYESTLTREERECRLYGRPLALAGAVYREFVYDMHVLADVPKGWKDYNQPPKSYTVRVAWDVHGARLPQAIMFAATAPDGTAFIYDEMFDEPLIGPCATRLAKRLEPYFVESRIIDPRALIKNPVTGTADVMDAIEERGLFFDPASKDLTTGISLVKEKLAERHVVTGLPTIYFSPRVAQTLFEFQHYVYNTDTNEPKDENNHMMENLYRLVINGLDYVPPVGDEEYLVRKPYVVRDPGNLRIR